MVEKRPVGNSGLEVAPLALGGNVFDWTADEATSFAVLDAFVEAGGTMIDTADVYSAWVPGHSGGESERADRPLAEAQRQARAGSSSPPRSASWPGSPPTPSARPATPRWSGSGSRRSTFITSIRTMPSVPLADSLGAFDRLVEAGKISAVGLSNFTAERVDEAMAAAQSAGLTAAERAAALVQHGRARRSSKARFAMRRCATGSRSSLITASPTAS